MGWDGEDVSFYEQEIENHFCTDEDLGIDKTQNTVMFPLVQYSQAEVLTYRKKFRCIDNDELRIWGDYNSAKAQQIIVRFKMCIGEDNCESEENIREWLKRKYIVILHNQIRFDSEQYFADSRVPESRIIYIPISSQNREIISFKVQTTNLELQDYDTMMLDEVT